MVDLLSVVRGIMCVIYVFLCVFVVFINHIGVFFEVEDGLATICNAMISMQELVVLQILVFWIGGVQLEGIDQTVHPDRVSV